MGPSNVTMARHLEQLQLREEFLRQRREARPPRPAVLVSSDGPSAAVLVTVRVAARPELN